MNNIQSQIEAILFATGEPVDIYKLASFLKLSKGDVEKEIEEFISYLEQQKRGLQIIRKNNTIQLVSAAIYGEVVMKFLNKKLNEPLTKTTLEVLAVIAYRGPVTRAQIEHVRGVNCSFTLRNLSIRGIIERKENPVDTRSYLYEVSNEFLKNSGLSSLEDLPDYETLHVHAIPQASGLDQEEIASDELKEQE